MKKRAILIVLDSAGIGELPDAADFGDTGANTICNIWKKRGTLDVPNMKNSDLRISTAVFFRRKTNP